MPLNINSAPSLLNRHSFAKTPCTSKHSTQSIHSSGGYVTTSTNVKASEIKPRASCLHPKLRMSAKEYTQYKELMDSMELSNKKVHFDDFSSRNESVYSGVSGTHTSLTAPISALDDDDTDYVPFEVFEPWRLQRFLDQVRTTSSNSDTTPARKQSERSAFSVEQAYDVPRKPTISTDYDIPIKKSKG
ncbi:TPA: hypothetical protein PXP39_004277 [Yersinia enterocolitica]|nr:hypothetical protein [Yersinia enterocolitica]HDL7830677.1 hypothetical protein [Yersinia enterocolitica]HDL7834314.1 hypothetical protein [Yersinia enterocolitica]HDL7871533.1 hypothetical protein [Yersinia enterocolitica]HDL7875179.1 hypothetical protein [Yersinia enterocolitica]